MTLAYGTRDGVGQDHCGVELFLGCSHIQGKTERTSYVAYDWRWNQPELGLGLEACRMALFSYEI